jgi:uroporphyrinogen decarboxylase
MTDRDRFVSCVRGDAVDRPPYYLFWAPWPTALERWHGEGLDPGVASPRDLFHPDQPPVPLPVNCGPCPRRAGEVLEEDATTVTFTDSWGIVRRDFKSGVSMPAFLAFPVSDRASWEAYRDAWLQPGDPRRLSEGWEDAQDAWTARGWPIQLGAFPDVGLFGGLRWLLGDEGCLLAFCTDPDLVHDILDHLTTLYLTVFEPVAERGRVDAIHLWEDMCSRQGPLIGPDTWEAFIGPHYRRIKAFADRYDIPVLSVDTDGNPALLVPHFIEAGVNLLYPMEVAAGCDVVDYRRRGVDLALLGGIDKRALARDPEAIDAELARVRPAIEAGRYIPALDHLVPDDVAWANYRHFAESLRALCGAA